MSYCVNCGVELSETEKHCPLCSVEVINPAKPWEEPPERPYSHHFDTFIRRVDRRYFASLAALLLLIPVLITFLYDIFSGGGITWSAYVMGGIALLFVLLLLPLLFRKPHTALQVGIDCIAVLLYLLLIETMSGGQWFAGLALPIVVFAGILLVALVVLFSGKRTAGLLQKTACLLTACGVLVVWVEFVIYLNAASMVFAGWSMYALIPCVVLSAASMMLEHRKNFKEQVRRRLFY